MICPPPLAGANRSLSLSRMSDTVAVRHPKNEDIREHFDIGEELGHGSFSVVHLCTRKTDGKQSAVKIIDKSKLGDKIEMIELEVKILEVAGSHPNIVVLEEIFETETHVFLILEIVNGGELFDKIVELQFYSEKVASQLIAQVMSATVHLHEKNIVHRDLKPENLLLESDKDDSPVKLADFGLSAFAKPGDKLTKAVGTPGYIAPEILMTLDEDLDGYNVEVDEWSIGIIMYILLCGFPPFFSEDDDECFDMIIAGEFDFPSPYWDNVSEDAKDLLRKLLVTDPAKRLTAADALKHPWLVSAAPDVALSENQASLKKFVAKQRWKKAINTTIAINKFAAWGQRKKEARK